MNNKENFGVMGKFRNENGKIEPFDFESETAANRDEAISECKKWFNEQNQKVISVEKVYRWRTVCGGDDESEVN